MFTMSRTFYCRAGGLALTPQIDSLKRNPFRSGLKCLQKEQWHSSKMYVSLMQLEVLDEDCIRLHPFLGMQEPLVEAMRK